MFLAGYNVLGLEMAGENLARAQTALREAHATHPELTNLGEGDTTNSDTRQFAK